MALPEDYLARFHNIFDAKEMWDSIKTRFGGNAKNTGYKGRDQRTGKQEQPKALLTIDVGVIDWSGQAEEEEEDHALMAFNSNRVPVSNEEKIRFMKIDLDDKTDVLTYHKKLLAEAEKEKEDLKDKVEKWHNSSKNLNILLNSQMSAKDKAGLGGDASVPPPKTGIYIPSGPDKEIDDSQFTYGPKQSKPSESDARSSDFTSCESNTSEETHESMPETVVNEPTVVSQPKVWNDAPIIEEYESDSEDEHVSLPSKEQETPSFANTIKHIKTPRQTVKQQNICSKSPKPDKKDCSGLISKKLGLGYGFTTKACFVCGSLSHLIRDCDFHEKRMAKQVELNKQKGKGNVQRENKPFWNNVQRVNHKNQFVPTTVLTRTGKILVKTARASGTNNLCYWQKGYVVKTSTGLFIVRTKRVLNSPCFMVKSWQVQDQTVLGKDYSNMLIADSLLKTIWFINAPCYGNEALASPKANRANDYCCDAEEMRCKFKIESENSAYTISIITAIVTSRYPITNNQLRNSSNPRQQATINNERVTLQPIQGRQTSVAAGTSRTYTPGASGNNSGKQRTVICYNCKGEGHMSKQCTKPKRKRDDSWFKRNQLQQHTRSYPVPSLSMKVFNNMKRPTKGFSGQEVALFPTMLDVTEPSPLPSRITSSPSHSPEPSTQHSPEPSTQHSPDNTTVAASQPLPTQRSPPHPSPGAEHHFPTPNESPLHAVHSHGSDEGSLKLNELMNLVTKLSDMIGALEDDLKKTKKTYSSAYTKLILRVKKLESQIKTRKARRKARVVLSDDEVLEDDSSKQGRKLSDAEVQEKASNEKGSDEVSTASVKKCTASEEVPIVSTAEVNLSTARETVSYTRRSVEKRSRQDKGKAIMIESEPKKKSKKELKQERLSFAEAIRLEEQINEEQRAQIARDEEIARQ
ncbi:ribonuclease H-like domain-containing protein [Tanacetum coccineum]